jgi:Histone H1-like nucleoprotein HC2
MALDALRGYVQLANGLTDVTRQRALQTAKQLLEQGTDVVDMAVSTAVSGGIARQAQTLAEDLLATSRTNRDLLIGLIRTEVERAVARLGLVGADELAAMIRVVDRLQSQLDAAIAFGGDLIPSSVIAEVDVASPRSGSVTAATEAPASKVPAKKVPASKVPAKKVPAKKVAAKTAVKKPAASQTTAKKVSAHKAAAKKGAAKKTVAKKAVGKKAVGKKAVAKTAAGKRAAQ